MTLFKDDCLVSNPRNLRTPPIVPHLPIAYCLLPIPFSISAIRSSTLLFPYALFEHSPASHLDHGIHNFAFFFAIRYSQFAIPIGATK